MKPAATLSVDAGGTVRCLYTEAIDLRSIGPLEIRRATRIEFDGKTQRWVVRAATAGGGRGKPLFAHASRERCLRWEQQNIGPA